KAAAPADNGWFSYAGTSPELEWVTDAERGTVLHLSGGGSSVGSFAIGNDHTSELGGSHARLNSSEALDHVGVWIKDGVSSAPLIVAAVVNTNVGDRKLEWELNHADLAQPALTTGSCGLQYAPMPTLVGDWLDGKWHYLELDVKGALKQFFPSDSLQTLD